MARLPRWLQRHTVQVEAYEGDGAYGPIYAAAVTVKCMVDDKRRLVRTATGDEAVAETTIYIGDLTTAVPPESRVTVNGRTTTVLVVSRHDAGGLPVPNHLEVALR